MVHNAIEYGMMAAFAEGFNLLHQAYAGLASRTDSAGTAPLEHNQILSAMRYQFGGHTEKK